MNWELTCSTTELLRHLEPKAGLEPATTRLGGDNPILRPVENAGGWTRGGFDVSGRESNPHLLVFTRCSSAVELPSSITEAQRPILRDDGQEVRWVVNRLSGCTGFEPDCGTRPLLPITQTQRPVEIGAPDGHRTHISRTESGRSLAVELRDCPRVRANFGADRGCGFVAVLGRVRWASGVIERRHSMPGIEPGPPRLSPRTVRPPYGGG